MNLTIFKKLCPNKKKKTFLRPVTGRGKINNFIIIINTCTDSTVSTNILYVRENNFMTLYHVISVIIPRFLAEIM